MGMKAVSVTLALRVLRGNLTVWVSINWVAAVNTGVAESVTVGGGRPLSPAHSASYAVFQVCR